MRMRHDVGQLIQPFKGKGLKLEAEKNVLLFFELADLAVVG